MRARDFPITTNACRDVVHASAWCVVALLALLAPALPGNVCAQAT